MHAIYRPIPASIYFLFFIFYFKKKLEIDVPNALLYILHAWKQPNLKGFVVVQKPVKLAAGQERRRCRLPALRCSLRRRHCKHLFRRRRRHEIQTTRAHLLIIPHPPHAHLPRPTDYIPTAMCTYVRVILEFSFFKKKS